MYDNLFPPLFLSSSPLSLSLSFTPLLHPSLSPSSLLSVPCLPFSFTRYFSFTRSISLTILRLRMVITSRVCAGQCFTSPPSLSLSLYFTLTFPLHPFSLSPSLFNLFTHSVSISFFRSTSVIIQYANL